MTTNKQTDIFSMFNLVDEIEEKKKRKQEELKRKQEAEKKQQEEKRKQQREEIRKKSEEAAKANPPAEKKKEVEKFEVNEDTVIRYYGQAFAITEYFTPEEIAEGILIKKKDEETERKPIDGESVRKKLEKEFPELVKEYTDIVFIKDKNMIIPTPKAKKKGNCRETSSYDGVSCFFSFSKIPFGLLQEFISVARLYGERNLEVRADIYYNMDKEEYFIDYPVQRVHPYWVEVIEDPVDVLERVMDAVKVLEIHSHHTMSPTPSTTDNKSERFPGMHYAIVGRIERFFPELFVRQFISEEEGHVIKHPESVFEYPFMNTDNFDTDKVEVEF